MEIEEAIKICEDFIEENKDRKIILHTAIQTVLRELKNSISKKKVEKLLYDLYASENTTYGTIQIIKMLKSLEDN